MKQWRFQWPDGTWIRWNHETETWEKEAPEAEGGPQSLEDILEPPLLPHLEPSSVASAPVRADPPRAEERVTDESSDPYFLKPKPAATRLTEEILPPEEEEIPPAPLTAAVVIGSLVGLGAGAAVVLLVLR